MFFYIFASFLCVFLRLLVWGFMPFWGVLFFSKYILLYFIIVLGIGVYFLLFMGWCRDTKYRLLGSYRSSSQRISYEVVIVFCVLFIIFLMAGLDYYLLSVYSVYSIFLVYFFMLFVCWFVSCLAERNRSPFDFSEGESELVSGFNTEYGGGFFSFIFIGEYSSIIVLSFLTAYFFTISFLVVLVVLIVSFFYLWVRTRFPRLRYDFLIIMAWKGISLLVLSYFFLWSCWF